MDVVDFGVMATPGGRAADNKVGWGGAACSSLAPGTPAARAMAERSAEAAEAALPDGCGSAREAASPAAASPASLTAASARKASFDADLPAAWRGTNEAVRDLHRNLHQIEVESGAFSPASTTPQPSRVEANRIQQSRTVQEWDVSAARFRLYPEIGTVCQAGSQPQVCYAQLLTRLSLALDRPLTSPSRAASAAPMSSPTTSAARAPLPSSATRRGELPRTRRPGGGARTRRGL